MSWTDTRIGVKKNSSKIKTGCAVGTFQFIWRMMENTTTIERKTIISTGNRQQNLKMLKNMRI